MKKMKKMKRLLMLGGSLYQAYAIREAKRLGYYVATCDYLPGNPGHRYADEYHDVSTVDKDAVLRLARDLRVDGVVAYASDPAAPTAAYVCERLGLPGSPYGSVEILSNKDLFRGFLRDHGFNCPRACGFSTFGEALGRVGEFRLPVMVKPVDSSGSKGVNKMTDRSQLEAFAADALRYSRRGRFLLEEFIDKKGFQISGDAFSVDGRLVFHCFGNEFYGADCDKDFAPLGECWPFLMDHRYVEDLERQLQRLLDLLGMGTGAYNVEAVVGRDDKVYMLEVGARSGGSLIPQVTEHATGVNMTEWAVRAAAGDPVDLSALGDRREAPVRGFWSNYMVHAGATGRFRRVDFDEGFRGKHLVDWVTDVRPGDPVHKFRDAQDCIGELILKYGSAEEMAAVIRGIGDKVRVVVE